MRTTHLIDITTGIVSQSMLSKAVQRASLLFSTGVKSLSKKDKQLQRMVFEAWREHTVESHASRFRKSLSLEQRGVLLSLPPCNQDMCIVPSD